MFEELYQEFKFPFTPHDFQLDTVQKLIGKERSGAFLAVGLGKTAVAIWIGLLKSITNNVSQLLILVPPALIVQWADYIKEITFADGTPLDVIVYYGTPTQRAKLSLKADIVITSHQMFRIDHKRFTKELIKNDDVFVIFDEMHFGLRNVNNKIFKRVRQFIINKEFLGLTATPISTPMDVYAITKLINPKAYTSKAEFERIHVSDRDFFGNVTKWAHIPILHERLYENAVKLEAEGLIELPDINYVTVPYNLMNKHLKLYKELEENEMIRTDDGNIIDATEAQRMFHTLQQFVTAPAKLNVERVQANISEICHTLYEEDESPMIIYANYKRTNQSLLEYFEKQKISVGGVWGEHTRVQQNRNVAAFKGGELQVLIGHPLSLGVGLNLQDVCHRIVFVELPLTSRDFQQSVGRCYRQNQKTKVVVKILQAIDTIQVSLYHHLINKDDLIQMIVRNKKSLRTLLTGEGK